ncbi:MAG: glycosyltransferase family 4 protein [Flavobacteriales bacterium]|nr:glycosyltransferase family 4 protein [Flavobacteriales bacterium]
MNVLQICHKPPVPSRDGGCLAMNAITQGLLKHNVSVKVLSISTPKHPFNIELLDEKYIRSTAIESIFIDTNIHPKDALLSLFKGESYNVNRFYDAAFEKLITAVIKNQKFNIIHLESIFVLPYLKSIRDCFKGKIVLRTHNVEHLIWKNLALVERNPFKKKYLQTLAKQLEKYELLHLNKIDGIASISEYDSAVFEKEGCKIPIKNISFGIDVDAINSVNNEGLFFLGSLDWRPNIEGVNWLSKVANKLSQSVRIAGRNPSKKLKLSSNMELVGPVKSAKQFMLNSGVMLVPLFSGSGIRIKILEAMSWGIPVVATPKAVEGLGVVHGEQVLITDNPVQFVNYANELLANKSKAIRQAQNAHSFVKKNYDNQFLTEKLISFYNQLLVK